MASEVDICNLALSHLGDSATVTSIRPPEGSAQAEYCARFYPMARDTLLEMHPWGFATMRKDLAAMDVAAGAGRFCYAVPVDCLRVIAVLPQDATDDMAVAANYVLSVLADGQQVIYADTPRAALRYIARVVDTSRFAPLFVMTLSWHLASMLAGVVMKGDVGAQFAALCDARVQAALREAKNADSLQFKQNLTHTAAWMRGR